MKFLSAALVALPLLALVAAPTPVDAAAKKKKTMAAAVVDPAISATLDGETSARVEAALTGAHRTSDAKSRDAVRHPKQMFAFAGLRSDMTVVEVSPGGGYWTEIFAPVMRDKGAYIAATGSPNGGGRKGYAEMLLKWANASDVYGKARVSVYTPSAAAPPEIAPAGSADIVWVARHIHGLKGQKIVAPAFKLYADALKSGGVLIVEQHRLPEARAIPADMTGYVKESEVIAFAEAAGLKLAGKSEINANAKDTADHPFGVWTLPPAKWTMKDNKGTDPNFDRSKYDAIGESDRMTLKFVKP
jgi:predicted methyltransferase